ncbi:MAG: ATP-binding protein, partial [Actinomycetota bacterium]|nr:ATP-binding protein [Actinomycetota bacterium]
ALQRTAAGEVLVASDAAVAGPDGTTVDLSVSAALVPSDTGTAHLLLVVADVTEQRRTQLQLHQSQRLESLGLMAGAVAHDYNNLLTVVLGYTDLVLRRLGPEHPSRPDLLAVAQAGDQARLLTDHLLTLSQHRVVQFEPVDPSEVIGSLEQMLRRLVSSNDIVLDCTASRFAGQVMADRGQLEQILLNLVVNARDALPDGGTITIATFPAAMPATGGPAVVIEFADTGVGMPEAVAARCFEPFFTTRPRGEGTGLGLATVNAVVTQTGGEITVRSRPGLGTTFRILLPATESLRVSEPVEHHAQGGTETVLLTEDDPAVRAFTSAVLEANGYTVVPAASGQDAIDLLERTAPDLLLTDVVLPGMNGVELSRRVTDLRPEIHVLLMSGFAEDASLNGRLDEVSFLPKPFSPDALLRAVRATIDEPVVQGSKR